MVTPTARCIRNVSTASVAARYAAGPAPMRVRTAKESKPAGLRPSRVAPTGAYVRSSTPRSVRAGFYNAPPRGVRGRSGYCPTSPGCSTFVNSTAPPSSRSRTVSSRLPPSICTSP